MTPSSRAIFMLIVSILSIWRCSGNGIFSFGNSKSKTRTALKQDLLDLSRATQRGLTQSPEQKEKIRQIFVMLEKQNPHKKSLASKLTSGKWNLEYTTSDSILGRKSPFKRDKIIQILDTTALTVENSEVVDYKLFKLKQKVTAELSPISPSAVAVQFKQFSFGNVLRFNAPESFKGTLDITYVDEDMRLSRGDKGNIFVLTREN